MTADELLAGCGAAERIEHAATLLADAADWLETCGPISAHASGLRGVATEIRRTVSAAVTDRFRAPSTTSTLRLESPDLTTPGERTVSLGALAHIQTRPMRPDALASVLRGFVEEDRGYPPPPIRICRGALEDGNHRLTVARLLELPTVAIEVVEPGAPYRPEPAFFAAQLLGMGFKEA